MRELVNAAMDSRDRGETIDEFLDHAALVADADDYDARAQITLMSLHAAKGLEFPLIFLSGLEEGLFPHSRTMLVPEDIEEERRLCYVGMTRAMDQLILTRAVYRRRYGTDLPEASVPSRFLEEVPAPLLEELGTRRSSTARAAWVGAEPPTAVRPGQTAPRAPIIRTKTKTRVQYGRGAELPQHKPSKSPLLRRGLTTQSRTLQNSLPAAARNLPCQKHRSKSPRENADSVRARR